MKKTLSKFMALSLMLLLPIFEACGPTMGMGNTATNNNSTIGKIMNIAMVAQEITGILGPILGLQGNQQSAFSNILKGYMQNTNSLTSLAGNNTSSYKNKLKNLNEETMKKMNQSLEPLQYIKLLALVRGVQNSGLTDGLLKELTPNEQQQGVALSSNAKNVLSTLLQG